MPRGVIVLLGGAGAVVTVAGMHALADILGPVLLALMLTVAVRPLMSWAERRGWPRWLAILITLLTINLIIIGLAGALAVSVAQLATILPTYLAQFAALIDEVTGLLGQVGIGTDQVRTALDQVDFSRVASLIGSLLVGLAGAFSNLLFIVALLLFLVLDAADFPARLRSVARLRPDIVGALMSFASGTRSYLIVSTIFGAIVAVIDTAALWLLAIPLPILWGLLAFITNYIPNIGFLIGLASCRSCSGRG